MVLNVIQVRKYFITSVCAKRRGNESLPKAGEKFCAPVYSKILTEATKLLAINVDVLPKLNRQIKSSTNSSFRTSTLFIKQKFKVLSSLLQKA